MLGKLASVSVHGHFPPVVPFHALYIISHRQHHLIADQTFIHQIQGDLVCHFPYHQTSFRDWIGTVQHLPGANAAGLRPIGLDVGNGAGFHAPCVIDQQLCIDTEQLIQQRFVGQGAACHVSHGEHTMGLQLACIALSHPPKICQRTVSPQSSPVTLLVQLGYPDTIRIGIHVLGHNVHGHFTKIQIGANSCSRCDAGGFLHVTDDFSCKIVSRQAIQLQIGCGIQKNLVNGVYMNVLGRHIFQINLIDLAADGHITGHLGWCNDIINGQRRISKQLHIMAGAPLQFSAGCISGTLTIGLLNFLHHFKQPCPSRDPIGFQGRTDRQTNGLFRTAGICNHQIGGHGIQSAFHALHRSVKGLQINGDITFLHPTDTTFLHLL